MHFDLYKLYAYKQAIKPACIVQKTEARYYPSIGANFWYEILRRETLTKHNLSVHPSLDVSMCVLSLSCPLPSSSNMQEMASGLLTDNVTHTCADGNWGCEPQRATVGPGPW